MGDRRSGTFPPTSGLPRDWLTPYVLLVLKEWQTHGYDLMQRLMELGFAGFDQSYLYRLLRQMEQQGLLVSTWDTTTKGPARRVYSLTDAGKAMLEAWAGTMDLYRKQMDVFFRMYGMSPVDDPEKPENGGS